MGAVISLIQDASFTVRTVLAALKALNADYQSLIRRASAPPGLPVPDPTPSYWLADPPFPALASARADLPAQADVVIIGSGITGAAAAKTLLELGGAAAAVVVLEARQLCGGATGRNGGHVKTVPHEAFAALRARGVGPERARELVRFQTRHLGMLREVGAGVPEGEVREVETVDLYLHGDEFEGVKRNVEGARRWLPERECVVWEAEEARAKFGVNNLIVGAVSYKSGAMWPYRLVAGVWNSLVKKHRNLILSTHTPVESITTSPSPSTHPHHVHSARGTIQARHVLHATNAFAPTLVPSLRGRLTGALAHMTAQRPGSLFPSPPGGTRSWSLMYAPGFDYVTQRPRGPDGAPGDLMVGGGFLRSRDGGRDQVGVWDDGRVDGLPAVHLRGAMAAAFEPNWGCGGAVRAAWTGVLTFTGDGMPFVGRVPDVRAGEGAGLEGEGQWVAAGYNGEGMVWAWLCGTAVAVMMLGREGEELSPGVGRPGGRLEEWFPGELGLDAARLKRADLRNQAGRLM